MSYKSLVFVEGGRVVLPGGNAWVRGQEPVRAVVGPIPVGYVRWGCITGTDDLRGILVMMG